VAPKPKVQSVAYTYDNLDRLATSKTKTGMTNTYGYDQAGNRTSWTRTGTSGNFSKAATFNAANQITQTTQTGTSPGTATYGYDAAGNRANQTINGTTTGYGYDPTGRTTAVTRDGRDTSYAYDGLGRQASSTDTTQYGSDTTTTVFNGLTPVQQADRLHGTTTMVRDAAGRLAQHINGDGGASWELLDRLGSTVAGAQGGSIIQLSSYSDWGDQAFATTGWNAPENYTGEQNDPSQGLNHYYARSYDPATGTWTSPDTWVGLIQQPQSLHRYAYVQNDPTTFIDALGNRLSDPSAYATPAKGCSISNPTCGGGYVHAPPPVKPKAPAAPPHIPKKKGPPKPKGPGTQSKVSKRHNEHGFFYSDESLPIHGGKGISVAAGKGNSDKDWTDKIGKIAKDYGESKDDVEDAIHALKDDLKYGGKSRNPDMEVNTKTGDVRIKGGNGEPIGNLDDYFSSRMSSQSTIDWGQVGNSVAGGFLVAGGIAIGILVSPVTAATG
jgi:RHS repeat-associated protein